MDKSAVYRGMFAIGMVLFAVSCAAGLAFEVAAQRRLPPLLPSPFEYARSLPEQGYMDEFVSEYRTAVAIVPHASWTHLQLGFALNHAGDASGALQAFRTAARLDPSSSTAHYNVAVLLLGGGDHKTARRHARKAQDLAREAGDRIDPYLLDALGLSVSGE